MPALSSDDVIEITDRMGIHINEYEGNYNLQSVSAGQNETWFLRWVFLSKWQDGKPVPDDKKRPMGVYLGDKETAVAALEMILNQLKGSSPSKEKPPF